MRAPLALLTCFALLACAGPRSTSNADAADPGEADTLPRAEMQATKAAEDSGAAAPWDAPPLERLASAVDTATGERLDLHTLLDRLAAADAVFLGESHNDASTHRAELAVYEGLLERRGQVVLAMEMFERDVQPMLDAYVSGAIDEPTFLAGARPWGNYRTGYRPLVEAARAAGQPVVASNFPGPLRGRVASGGLEALETLRQSGGDAADQVPAEILANTRDYHRRVDNAIRGHLEMMRAHGAGEEDDQRLTSTQTLWDNAMGDSVARALDAHAGAQVLHVNGGFHSEYRDGTVRQLLLRRPDTAVLTVAIVASDAPHAAAPDGVPAADFMLYVQRRETEENEGWWSVRTGRDLRYRLHMPHGADDGALVPLLLWLPGNGLSADDGMELARALVGDDVAIAVFEAPYRETQADLGVGGRWFWSDSFASDLGTAAGGIAQAWAYLVRQFPVDPQATVLAGEGAGATVVAAATLYGGELPYRSVALRPAHYRQIKDMPLPLPEYASEPRPAGQALTVVTGSTATEWWRTELEAYQEVGMDARQVDFELDAWRQEAQVATLLHEALGLEPPAWVTGAPDAYAVVPGDATRARHWTRMAALRHAVANGDRVALLDTAPDRLGPTRLETAVRVEDFVAGRHAVPLCPGPFGGTTVLVLPPDLGPEARQAWLDYVASEPLQKRSRFHRLRVAELDGERNLATVLAGLSEQGRTNVLIVPAAFHAGDAMMRTLARAARAVEDGMTLHWLPGLGGEL